MSRCRETAGILFKHRCTDAAVGVCSQCKKPICQTHSRTHWQTIACVACLRQLIHQQPQQRQSLAHLRDDPYFYWYFSNAGQSGHDYLEEDYALFEDAGGPDFGADTSDAWEGT